MTKYPVPLQSSGRCLHASCSPSTSFVQLALVASFGGQFPPTQAHDRHLRTGDAGSCDRAASAAKRFRGGTDPRVCGLGALHAWLLLSSR